MTNWADSGPWTLAKQVVGLVFARKRHKKQRVPPYAEPFCNTSRAAVRQRGVCWPRFYRLLAVIRQKERVLPTRAQGPRYHRHHHHRHHRQ